ncbi:cysteine desulfurase family protein [Pseudochrobactrum kiredjianiae]|uniref:Cysteine desulfurase n=1 Tax=Pseudochrobactrum kiredjianiae TaxID=386305 RepID=A0ABW3V3U9_9HYPH|nr:cysteine desulfurase family protein [Pseudochrobactrum kiredjianiae]MDM7851722.1 cysteine desulfurase family protein [Pseudochrobactrum kiredjianiae]
MSKPRIYFDYNASAPLSEAAREAVIAALQVTGNPSSVHQEGRASRALIEAARRDVAALCNAKPDHVFFTSGATEAATTLLTPVYKMGRSELRLSHLYVSATEHPCMLSGGRFAAENMTVLPVDPQGIVDLQVLEQALKAHDKSKGLPLVAVQWANNETGVIQPVEKIGALVKAAGGFFIVDAVQAAGRVALDIAAVSADYLILSSHKIGGPKGVGAVVAISDLVMPSALVRGGGQEKGHRAGTEALPLIAGFGAAAREALAAQLEGSNLPRWSDAIRTTIEDGVSKLAEDVVVHGAATERLPNTSFISLPGMKAETMQIAFDLGGIALSAGSACSSGKVGASHVLAAMGFDDECGALRVSTEKSATMQDAEAFLTIFERLVARRDQTRSQIQVPLLSESENSAA